MMCPEWLTRFVFYPIWDIWDRSIKLRERHNLVRSQMFDRHRLEDLQWKRFKEILQYAATNSPYYAALWQREGIDVDSIDAFEDLVNLPITTKADIRNNLDQFISKQFAKEDLVRAKTGGSTGFSLDLYFDKRCQERRNAAAMRSDEWAGWRMGYARGDLWGNPPLPKTFKQKVRNQLLDKICYLDTMKMDAVSMRQFHHKASSSGVKVIFGHAHSIYLYAKFLDESNIEHDGIEGIIATSMMLLAHERAVIERVFSCKVTNRYGCEEVGLIASECAEHNGMHINMEHVLVEFVREDGSHASENEVAKILVTDLNNKGMPLIRYQVEDMGSFSLRACDCGRGHLILNELSGRVADFLKTKQGHSVAGISLIERTLTKIPGIEQMQLVQNSLDKLDVNLVRARDYSADTEAELKNELFSVFGQECQVDVNIVDSIPQQQNGKYRFSICNI